MNKNIDLTKILKDCPKGWKFYSILYGEVKFEKIKKESEYPIVIITKHGNNSSIKSDGRHYGEYDDGECTLFPSKAQRDWSKFTAPWYKKERNTIAQLEEQGEQEEPQVYETEDGEIITYSETDGYKFIEPKFHEGDWVVRGDTIAQIVNIQEQYYVGLDINGKDFVSSRFLNGDKIHLWTINDAKDGDVLALSWLEDKNLWAKIVIFKKYHSEGVKGLYYNMPCVEGYGITFKNGKTVFNEKIPYYSKTWTCNLHPATKEQRDLLLQKMKEAGYKWNTETNTSEKLVEPKFDPKTLKPFDKVLVKDFDETSYWRCNLFSHYNKNKGYYYCSSAPFDVCIPYNDETKHLVGTKDEAPEYYRYWED